MGVANTLALVVERIGVLAAQFNLFLTPLWRCSGKPLAPVGHLKWKPPGLLG